MSFDAFFQRATGRSPYAFQRAFAEAESWPDLLEAPTGSGKTATAILGWLWRRRHGSPRQRAEAGRRLVFCLPMRTLVEQTLSAATTWAQNLGLGVDDLGIHALLGGAVDDAWEGHPDRDNLLIGTQDQLLSRALMRGYAMSRYLWPVHFAQLHADCTWVLDEVQLMGVGASTAAQLQAFRERFGVFGGARTLWMTATLSEGRLRTVDFRRPLTRLAFEASEPALVKRLHATKRLRKASTAVTKDWRASELAKEVAAAHVPGSLTLVVVNRVARAQQLRDALSRLAGIEAVSLIHSRFRPADRAAIQREALSGSFQGILVATQAIEAGVDLSARTLFTEVAPWSSLVQRFGRLNRAGEHDEAIAHWIDVDVEVDDLCRPYEQADLRTARERLEAREDVSPEALRGAYDDPEEPAVPVLRAKDLLELFDTEPDLAGRDIDVSSYIRATDDRDVQVAWRRLDEKGPSADAPDLQRDELCSVAVHDLEKLLRERDAWRFDGLKRRWTPIPAKRLVPGMTLVVDVQVGGYDPQVGFTRDPKDIPGPVERPGAPPDFDEADDRTFETQGYVTLRVHSNDAAEAMEELVGRVGHLLPPGLDPRELADAARWHDLGKAHEAFQEMLVAGYPADHERRREGPWAKSDRQHSGRNPRRFFRHELASALAWLAAGRSDLGAFLIAAHHGKVRLALRSRPGEEGPPSGARFAHGVHEGDALPEVDLGGGTVVPSQTLSLACMELGGAGGRSWADRMTGLLRTWGPFRLGYLEMLVRIADWRATRRRVVLASLGGSGAAREEG